MRAAWTASGGCTSGSTAHPKDATRRASGGATTTRTTKSESRSQQMPLERASRQVFLGASGLLFVASAAVTIIWCASMSAMGEMPMPGGWTMSAVWVRMPGQTWPGVAASFLGMWIVMMVAMMLPSIVPTLWRYRQAVGRAGMTHPHWLTALVGMGYFFVWTLFGAAVFPLGVGLSAIAMR